MPSPEGFIGGFYWKFKGKKVQNSHVIFQKKTREHLSTHYLMPGFFLFQNQTKTIQENEMKEQYQSYTLMLKPSTKYWQSNPSINRKCKTSWQYEVNLRNKIKN